MCLAYFKTAFLDGSNLYQSTKKKLQENEVRKIDEDETGEFIGIINYSMALIQLELEL
jgi:hypothetical protein